MTKADLLAALALRPVEFELPNGAGKVLLAPLSAADRQAIAIWRREHAGQPGLYERLVIASLRDPDGTPTFTAADLETVGALDGATVEAIALRVVEINGLAGDGGKAQSTGTRN